MTSRKKCQLAALVICPLIAHSEKDLVFKTGGAGLIKGVCLSFNKLGLAYLNEIFAH